MSPPPLGWSGILRLGLVQAGLGAVVVLVVSTLNRVMVVELALPALLPGGLIALHYAVQLMRPCLGYGGDVGRRRTPWIVGGMAALTCGGMLAACGTVLMARDLAAGILVAACGYVAVGLGVGAAGTSLLTLLAARVAAERRAQAATVLWLMMILGIALAASAAGHFLTPFGPVRLLAVMAAVGGLAFALSLLAVAGIEGVAAVAPARATPFLDALREVWAEPASRRFGVFVGISMLAYSAQEVVLEPFAGAVFGLAPGQGAALTGLLHVGVLAGMAVVAAAASLAGGYRAPMMRVCTVGGCLASALAMSGLVCAALVGPAWPLRLSVLALGAANGAFAVSAIGAMMGLAGDGRRGREGLRVGVWGAAQALAFAAGGLFGSGLIVVTHRLATTQATSYAAVFAAEALVFLWAARLAAGVFRRRVPAADALPAF